MKRTLIAVAAFALLLGACSSASGESSDDAKTSTTTGVASSITGSGDTVTIGGNGFSPQWLIATVGQKVTFTNETKAAEQIVFDNAFDTVGKPLESPSIPPGKTWVWKADSFASFAYHAPGLPGVDGRIQVEPPAEPD